MEWFLVLSPLKAYGLLFCLMLLNGLVSAPASELVWGTTGLLVSSGKLSVLLSIIIGVTGNLVGNIILFLIASKWGKKGIKLIFWFNPSLSDKLLEVLEKVFVKRGEILIFIVRLIPTVRSIISIPAGIAKMPFLKFVLYTFLGCLLWAIIWVGIGVLVGEEIKHFIGSTRIISLFITIIMILLSFFYLKKRVSEYFNHQ